MQPLATVGRDKVLGGQEEGLIDSTIGFQVDREILRIPQWMDL